MKLPYYPLSIFKEANLLKYLSLRITAYSWLRKHAADYDAIILRYPLGDPLLPLFITSLDNVFTIHHTKELPEISTRKSFVSRIHFVIEKLVGKVILRKANGIIGLTEEIAKYETNRIKATTKSTYVSTNGVDMSSVLPPKDSRNGKIKLLCLCSKAYPWQGLDLITSEFKTNKRNDIELHFVGSIDPKLFNDDKRFFFHGRKSPNELEEIFAGFDLGLGSFALHRNSMKQACILKTRDYLSNGLPVYANYIDSGLPENFPYFFNDTFDLDMAHDIATELRSTAKATIQQKARKHIDKNKIVSDLASWIYKNSNLDNTPTI